MFCLKLTFLTSHWDNETSSTIQSHKKDLQTNERMPEPKSSMEEWFAISKTSVSVPAYRLQSLKSHMFDDIQPLWTDTRFAFITIQQRGVGATPLELQWGQPWDPGHFPGLGKPIEHRQIKPPEKDACMFYLSSLLIQRNMNSFQHE